MEKFIIEQQVADEAKAKIKTQMEQQKRDIEQKRKEQEAKQMEKFIIEQQVAEEAKAKMKAQMEQQKRDIEHKKKKIRKLNKWRNIFLNNKLPKRQKKLWRGKLKFEKFNLKRSANSNESRKKKSR